MNNLLLALAIAVFTVQTLSFKKFNQNFMKNFASYFAFNFLCSVFIVVIFMAISGFSWTFHIQTVLIGMLFGVLYIITVFVYTKAMGAGPLSYTALFFSLSLLVPVIYGILFWNEKLSLIQGAGLVLLLITFYLGSKVSNDGEKKASLTWLILCIATLLSNGSLGVIGKAHQLIMPGREIIEFLIIAFGTSAVLSLLLFLWYNIIKNERIDHLKKPGPIYIVIGAGLATAFGNQLVLYLAGRMPAVILFPIVNGGGVVTSAIVSFAVFKEAMTRKGITGLITGLIAIVLLSLK